MKIKQVVGLLGLGTVAGALGGLVTGAHVKDKMMGNAIADSEKYHQYFKLSNQWLILKNEGKLLEAYFLNHGFKTIAIYGMADLGQRLSEELGQGQVSISYGIDQKAESLYWEFPVYPLEQELPKADVIVVTPTYYFDEICLNLTRKKEVSCPVISLEDVIYELL